MGFNPANVTHYDYDPATGYLVVAFTSGEWVRYTSARAREIFDALTEDHWQHADVTRQALATLSERIACFPEALTGGQP